MSSPKSPLHSPAQGVKRDWFLHEPHDECGFFMREQQKLHFLLDLFRNICEFPGNTGDVDALVDTRVTP